MPKEIVKESESLGDDKPERLITKPKGFATVDAAKVAEEAQPLEKHLPGSKMDDDEYEYVDLSEATQGVIGNIRRFASDHAFAIFLVGVGVACFLILLLGRTVSTVVIALAFAMIALGFAFFIYEAWQVKKEAERQYLHAEEIKKAAMAKLKEEGLATGDDDE